VPKARIAGAVAAMGLAVLATTAFVVPASADSKTPTPAVVQPPGAVPAGFGTWNEVYAFQARLNAAAERILAAGGAGNASIVAGPQNHELRVYWKGKVDASMLALAKGLDVPVVFLPARFTHSELVKQAQRLAANPRVVEAAPQADGSGLAVTVADRRLQTDQSDLQATTQIPLTITAGPRPQAMFNRQADVPLFWGGSAYGTPIGGCTNGFPLQVAGSPNVFMISAGHCGNNGDAANITGQTAPTGTLTFKNTCRDTLLINYPAGVSAAIYTGAFNSSTSAAVVDTTPDFVGNLVATGGSSSGEHLNIPVQAVDVFTAINGIACTTVGPLTRAGYNTATCAVAPGDSGGPAYSYFSGATVLGRGTITAGIIGTATCPGVVANGSKTVFYAPLVRPAGDAQVGSLASYGVGLLTCPSCVPALVTVPNVVGQSVSEAAQTLNGVGLQVGQITGVNDFSCNNIGTVSSQNPGAGAQVTQGSAVNLSVGQMPPPPFQCP
jgi:hypothetical protein